MPTLTRNQTIAALSLFGVLLLLGLGSFLRRGASASSSALSLRKAGAPAALAAPGNAPDAATDDLPSANLTPSPVPSRPPIVVHVVGCVRQPGVFSFPEGARILDAVKRAGGAKPHADLEAINLAAKLEDATQIYVPSKEDTRSRREAADKAPARSPRIAISPAPPGRVPLAMLEPLPMPPVPPSERPTGKPERSEAPEKISSPAEGRVNINRADAEQLQRLPGIGPAMAGRILEYRKQNGSFKTVEELLEVRGIGEKRLAVLRELVEL